MVYVVCVFLHICLVYERFIMKVNLFNTIDYKALPLDFNKKKTPISYSTVNNKNLSTIQNYAYQQCMGKKEWSTINTVNAWMITAETATFMKWGGLGVVASELPESYNKNFSSENEQIAIVTPLYLGNTGKKRAYLEGNIYNGAENKKISVSKIITLKVPFCNGHNTLVEYSTDVLMGELNGVTYLFIQNDRFFSINPSPKNNPAQDGCYVLNENNINEVERFAFFSKAVYCFIKHLLTHNTSAIKTPNLLVANDWHSGALSGLTKYFTTAQVESGQMSQNLAASIAQIPIIHLAHHLGYQGWDYPNTARILNSLYENLSSLVFKNAKAIKNSNPRTTNTLIVYDCYNQASCNFHLADRVVTVSKNYMEEVSKELDFGFDFRDILKIRKDHRSFFGIVNGYDKQLISPNQNKINALNEYFAPSNFVFYDQDHLQNKLEDKKEFIKLLSKIATDKTFKDKVIPLIDIYKFADIAKSVKRVERTPIICATSRLVEQKGYDIAATSIINLAQRFSHFKNLDLPIFILGGAGDNSYFEILTNLKDKITAINPKYGERIFVFRGYQDHFAYAIQLASDFYMMPCRFEPCGLTQMEAMAKGTLPVAMSTGGLVDTIENDVDGFRTAVFFSTNKRKVYGTNLDAQRLKNNINAYTETLEKALTNFYRQPKKIAQMTSNAMHKDFSWNVKDGSIYKYRQLFKTGSL